MEIGITKLSSRGQAVIPQEMREGLKEGEKLIVIKRNDEIILKKQFPENALWSEKSLANV